MLVCKQASKQLPDVKVAQKGEEDPAIFCSYCRNIVTHPDHQILINGSFKHVFANPHGFVYEIGCFSQAAGCRPASILSSEFSWFAGYSWKIVVCSHCVTHLGWQFISENDQFLGLIIDKLVFP